MKFCMIEDCLYHFDLDKNKDNLIQRMMLMHDGAISELLSNLRGMYGADLSCDISIMYFDEKYNCQH